MRIGDNSLESATVGTGYSFTGKKVSRSTIYPNSIHPFYSMAN